MVRDAPFFSILLPTRDRPDLAADCVGSILEQELKAWEVLVLDQSNSTATGRKWSARNKLSNPVSDEGSDERLACRDNILFPIAVYVGDTDMLRTAADIFIKPSKFSCSVS